MQKDPQDKWKRAEREREGIKWLVPEGQHWEETDLNVSVELNKYIQEDTKETQTEQLAGFYRDQINCSNHHKALQTSCSQLSLSIWSVALRCADCVTGGVRIQQWNLKGYRQISSPVLLVSAKEGIRLARHAVSVPSTWYVLKGKNTRSQFPLFLLSLSGNSFHIKKNPAMWRSRVHLQFLDYILKPFLSFLYNVL